MAGRELAGVEVDPSAPIQHCRSCGAPVWWGRTAAGKRCPFDVMRQEGFEAGDVSEVRTPITHFSTCPQARKWGKR